MSALARREPAAPRDDRPVLSLVHGPEAPDERELIARARVIGAGIAAETAGDVDERARFPHEAFAALREARLLGAMVPRDLGGAGLGIRPLAEICNLLAQGCASTAMIYAMHQIKVSSLVVHCADEAWMRAFMARIAADELLLASATTEGSGVGGDMRQSVCAITRDGPDFTLAKGGCLISYGAEADAILVTARTSPDAPPSDQSMAVLMREQYELRRIGAWNTMGMRGTSSHSFDVSGRAPASQVIATPFAEIAAQSMLPFAHLLWGSVWCGIASDAVSRAETFVRGEARKRPGVPPAGAVRLAELLGLLARFRALVAAGIDRYEAALGDPDLLAGMSFSLAMNGLKVSASQSVVEIVNLALLICGIAGYRNDGPSSLSRHMRDALSAQLMINNDRILGNMSQLVAVHRHDQSLFG